MYFIFRICLFHQHLYIIYYILILYTNFHYLFIFNAYIFLNGFYLFQFLFKKIYFNAFLYLFFYSILMFPHLSLSTYFFHLFFIALLHCPGSQSLSSLSISCPTFVILYTRHVKEFPVCPFIRPYLSFLPRILFFELFNSILFRIRSDLSLLFSSPLHLCLISVRIHIRGLDKEYFVFQSCHIYAFVHSFNLSSIFFDSEHVCVYVYVSMCSFFCAILLRKSFHVAVF